MRIKISEHHLISSILENKVHKPEKNALAIQIVDNLKLNVLDIERLPGWKCYVSHIFNI